MREYQFDGLVGPTHNYGGLSPGNLASAAHEGQLSNPRAAARQGLAKMRFVLELGVKQAVLPPHDRPHLPTLRRLGFRGRDEEVIAEAAKGDGLYLRLCSSASAMWAANAATVAPSSDTADGRVHMTPANLQSMFHRTLEAPTTTGILRAIFSNPSRFDVHEPLPGGGQLADEGGANHLRLATGQGSAHVFAWGRRAWPLGALPEGQRQPQRNPARQTYEASQRVASLHGLPTDRVFFPQQHPQGIDQGAFHTDVLAVGNECFLLMHELAFADDARLLEQLRHTLGEQLHVVRVTSRELSSQRAVAAYPFNSQVLTLPDRSMAIVAPVEARDDEASRTVLESVVAGGGPVSALHFIDVRQSMQNGGGPACLRLRVPLTDEEAGALSGNVILNEALHEHLCAWVDRHYRDRLLPSDLCDPQLAVEAMRAVDELTGLLELGPIYDFQR